MPEDRKLMKIGLVVAAVIMIVRILLERAGAALIITNVFGVTWLYFIMPVLFAIAIRIHGNAKPYGFLLKDIVLFAVYTRVMVAITYVLAYYMKWDTPRFEEVLGTRAISPQELLFILARIAFSWIVMAVIVGMIIGSITLFVKREKPTPAPAA